MTLRKHQREVVEACREILGGKPISEILLSVTPGGGKSFVPVILAENLIPAIADKICWIVPRNSLKYQGEAEFCDPRWQTDKRIRAAENGDDLSRGFAGYVTTYQAVGQNPECHAAEFSKHKYILFLDEFHHVAQGSEWHKALEPLVKSAALAVLASGTLSRGDGQRIAFLKYEYREILNAEGLGCGFDIPNKENTNSGRFISYSRSEAIKDGAIMKVEFNLIDGESEWEELDGRKSASKLSGEESAKALFTALRTDFANQLISAALIDWIQQSVSYPDAKLLVVAPNIEISKTYFDCLCTLRYNTRIATSEDTPQARKNIEDFKRGVYKILVTVAMAYEGLNVPEISVICCLSHIRSVPWLEQCFARANRICPDKHKAVIYAPADWAIKKAVRMIRQEQLAPLKNPEGQTELDMQNSQVGGDEREGGGGAKPWIIPISSSAETSGRLEASASPDLPQGCPPSEAEKILRKNINGIITAFLDKQPHGNKQAQSKMLYRRMRLICEKPVSNMNQRELEKAWLWVMKEYGGNPVPKK
jgi:superfamily II DNA or RNA helicase